MLGHIGISTFSRRERGSTLLIVAGSLTVLLGIGALAIDIGSLYVARSETQRAADAAALAGAKVFVETGCVTSGDCTTEETTASDRATQVAQQNLVQGQSVTISGVTFKETPQNPQITIQVQSPNLHVYFAGAVGITTAPTVGATATAEAYNPSGQSGAPAFCTGCVRPWLISNSASPVSAGASFLDSSGAVENSGCSPGVIGQTLQIALEPIPPSQPQPQPPLNLALFGAVDDGTGLTGYQKSIATCNTGQMTCGSRVNTLAGSKVQFTTPGINALLHLPSGTVGLSQGQDSIDTTVCPPQIHAGSQNPLVVDGVIAQDALIATSDSIVTAYLFNGSLNPNVAQSVTVTGFVQIFVTQVDVNGEVWGVILGVAGCPTSDGDCDRGSIQGPTLLPVRLITPGSR
jgi:Putative Flp pilus-assembly TadE/G-like